MTPNGSEKWVLSFQETEALTRTRRGAHTIMPEISEAADIFTLVNVFTVSAERQDDLIKILSDATDNFVAAQPGFISTSFHKGDDGTTVVNYAQWQAKEDWQAMLATPAAKAHVTEVQAMIDGFQSTPCRVARVHLPSA